ncbi:hypothetical protein SAMN05421538_102435 [Paracoccus isoporae]|uniref:DUF1285 domain-containing protein n=1 Tax=Paracoccus isoporae TaxID=591205 RepID=A0A1G6XL61_9RHOB|nr:DUF1285 domain-containing protein [Paracoccus isoporae]SDD78984.1 hypothetical protein SAMN05421538_102435 [Paracoccus isoporae]
MGKPTEADGRNGPAADRAGGLIGAAKTQGTRGPAPVHLWDPPYCGEMDLTIRADGVWIHEGAPIGRPEMVRMFANIMKFEDGRHYLVTPVEKIGIQVEDSPFIAVDVDLDAAEIRFTTNIGDQVTLGPDHPLTIAGTPDEPRPYVEIRGGLLARIDRKSFYRLAEAASAGPDGRMGVTSGGRFFPLET